MATGAATSNGSPSWTQRNESRPIGSRASWVLLDALRASRATTLSTMLADETINYIQQEKSVTPIVPSSATTLPARPTPRVDRQVQGAVQPVVRCRTHSHAIRQRGSVLTPVAESADSCGRAGSGSTPFDMLSHVTIGGARASTTQPSIRAVRARPGSGQMPPIAPISLPAVASTRGNGRQTGSLLRARWRLGAGHP